MNERVVSFNELCELFLDTLAQMFAFAKGVFVVPHSPVPI